MGTHGDARVLMGTNGEPWGPLWARMGGFAGPWEAAHVQNQFGVFRSFIFIFIFIFVNFSIFLENTKPTYH